MLYKYILNLENKGENMNIVDGVSVWMWSGPQYVIGFALTGTLIFWSFFPHKEPDRTIGDFVGALLWSIVFGVMWPGLVGICLAVCFGIILYTILDLLIFLPMSRLLSIKI
jgi:hypothetical protein